MIGHIWSILCSRSIIDPRSNNVTLVDIVERIQLDANGVDLKTEDKVLIPFSAELVSLWQRTDFSKPAKGEMKTTVLGPNGSPIPGVPPTNSPIDLAVKNRFRLRNFGKINGLPFVGYGNYIFRVELRVGDGAWKLVADVPLEISANEITSE